MRMRVRVCLCEVYNYILKDMLDICTLNMFVCARVRI